MPPTPVVAELRLARMRHNLQLIRQQTPPGTTLCAAVKANAYGHGVAALLPALRQEGVETLAAATVEEGLELRSLGWHRDLLTLTPIIADGGAAACESALEAVAAGMRCTVTSMEEAGLLASAATRLGRVADIDVQLESGMGRLGMRMLTPEHIAQGVGELAANPQLCLRGVYTHFATADEPDLDFATEQLGRFQSILALLGEGGVRVPCRHAANSAAVFRLSPSHLDMVRPGLAVYGYWAGPPAERPDLQPVLRVTTRLLAVRSLPAGHGVGYGCSWRTARESTIGVLPVGYADGFFRRFGPGARVGLVPVRGRRAMEVPVVGRVSMDLVTVDLTEVPDARVGDGVVLIDDEVGASNSVEAIAARTGTIPYEITTGLGRRIERRPV